ncbi:MULTISPECIES: HNH endonuclease signature motif containing protein [Actinosynnema]|uniref:HNH endonuclease n=1 Tax=Actinosynnema TaxID=40566 RepID=UPI0020A2B598|nr:HNH endonuclease signature motif containing protein [Actinosynnema pretiosum]
MDDDVRYLPGQADENSVLRLALLESWGNRCYMCSRPTDFSNIQIDHIIPQDTKKDKLAELLSLHLSPERREGFDIHALGNLAPACAECNRKKSNRDLLGVGITAVNLDKAHKLEASVVKKVKRFKTAQTVEKELFLASTADMNEPASRQAFMDFAPLVISRISVLDVDMLEGYSTTREVSIAQGDSGSYEEGGCSAVFILNNSVRRARVIVEDFYGMDFDDMASHVMSAVHDAVVERVRDAIASNLGERGHHYPDVGDPSGRLFVEADSLTFDPSGEFTAGGTFAVDMSAHAAVVNDDGSGTDWLQEDVAAHGRFSISFFPVDGDPTRVDVDSAEIIEWKAGVAPW